MSPDGVTEHTLLREFLADYLKPAIELLDGGFVFKHNDSTSGLPDVHVTSHGRTSWHEFKLADPDIDQTDLQNLTCKRLAASGDCWYHVYEERRGIRSTLIVHPRDMSMDGVYTARHRASGFDHKFLVKFIRHLHRVSL